jgi:hypothetical protein
MVRLINSLKTQEMHKIYTTLVVASTLLVGCDVASSKTTDTIGTIKDFGTTASGAINDATNQFNEALNTGKSMTDGVMDMIEDAKNRINQVQSGVNLLMEGKEMIEGGVKGEEEEE